MDFSLPAIGEGVVEGEIVRWLKQPGDAVAANEALVEVMTDKATVEIPSPHAGVLAEIVAPEGKIAAVGEVIARLGSAQAGTAAAAAPTSVPSVAPTKSTNARVMATPSARATARESGIDLTAIETTSGRITKADVLAAARPLATVAKPMAPAAQASKPAALTGDERLAFRGMRRRIAEGLSRAYATAVHYTYVEQINVTELVRVRNQARKATAQDGISISYLPFIIKAVVRGLKKYPIVNAYLDEEASEIVLRRSYHIGVATATEQGLTVPVVRDADRLSLLDIASEIERLSAAAREGKASRDELTGSTFTITSLGAIGGLLATPILNHPEVGILGVHAIRKVPVVGEGDVIEVGHIMNLSASFDHRIVDGFEGASFLQEVRRYLEDPTLLLLSGV